MASGNFSNQSGYPDYNQYYYGQQYPPQFYYQYNPQNQLEGVNDPQNLYQQAGAYSQSYIQSGDYQASYSQGGSNQNNFYNQRGGNFNRSRGQHRGRGHQNFNSREENRYQQNRGEYEQNKDRKCQSDNSKENIPVNNSNRQFTDSQGGRGRGRGSGQYTGSRQFNRGYNSSHNRDEIGESRQYESRNNYRDKRGSQRQHVGPDHSNDFVGGGQNEVTYNDNLSNNSNRQKSYHGRDEKRESNWKDRNKHYYDGGGGRSPRQIETDSRSSFDKRNNPKQNQGNLQKDGNNDEQQDKKYKMLSTDRKYTSKKQMMKVLAGKVDETQRGVLIEQLTLGTYECMVCCETVRCHHAIWNCPGCFHAFHLRCIKKWARSPTALVEGEESGWRCPACQKVADKVPNQYKCFCGKLRDPEYDRMETPHSCGQVCGKKRGDNCSHPCNILCHPGPCPPCNAVVNRTCACGKESKSIKCCITDVIKCEKVCSKVLNCGKHFCKATCHSGSCEPCEEIIEKECYGGHEKKEVKCGCADSFTKSYSCEKQCKKLLLCGNHECDTICHAGDCKVCKTLPEVVTHCPCGATPLSDLTTMVRTSCTDPIPRCDQICNKPLGCGPSVNPHMCQQKCHEGCCGACDGVTELTCRCGAVDRDIPCVEVQQYTEDKPFTCDRRCNKKRTCGRHKCGQLCCVNEEHVCLQLCNKKLSCGLHKCEEPCHRGNCPPCLMSGYDELTCHCGAEVLMPPIPCGTKPPECKNVCQRQHNCDHTVYHHCNSDPECPPCTVLTEKWCMGKHELRKNIPCHFKTVSCGLPCNKVLPCQQHKCLKVCHADECQKENENCIQPCRIKRKDCNHMCAAPCHYGTPCPQTPCKAEVLLMCKCGNKEAKVPCLSNTVQDTADYQKLTMQSLAGSLQSGQAVDISQLSKKKKRQLECDSECAILERNRRMALALEIRNPDVGAKLGNPTFTDFLKDYTKQNAHFVSSVEKALSDLVKNSKQSKHPHRSHSFTPGNRDQRRVIHELAESYGCETQSYDYEPKKNVVATAYKDKCWLPSVTLTSYIQRELHPKAPVPIPHVHCEESLRQTAQAAKQSTEVLGDIKLSSRREYSKPDVKRNNSKPDIDYFDFSTH